MQSKYSRLFNISVLEFMTPKDFANYVLIHKRSYTKFSYACLMLLANEKKDPIFALDSIEEKIFAISNGYKVIQFHP